MTKLENTQDIRLIVMKPTAHTKCVIGGDWYTNRLEINFVPGDYYPDYMEVQDWIMENIDGKALNIEDVVDQIERMLREEYCPADLEIANYIEGCKTHFDVVVIK